VVCAVASALLVRRVRWRQRRLQRSLLGPNISIEIGADCWGTPSAYSLKCVRIGMVTGAAADATKAIATAAFGIGPIETAYRYLYQKWNSRKRAQGHQGDGGSLTCGTFDSVRHKQTKAKAEGSPGHGQKRIDW